MPSLNTATNQNLKSYGPQLTLGMSYSKQRLGSKVSTGGRSPRPLGSENQSPSGLRKGRGVFGRGADTENSDSDDMEMLIEQDLAMHELNGQRKRLGYGNGQANNGHHNGMAPRAINRLSGPRKSSVASPNSGNKYKELDLYKEKHAEADLIENFGLVLKHINDLKE